MTPDPVIESTSDPDQIMNIQFPQTGTNKTISKAGKTDNNNSDEVDQHSEIATPEEFIFALETAYKNDKNLHVRLLYSTLGKIRYFTFNDEVNGQTAEDVIQNVIELVIMGKRKWNRRSFKDVTHYLLVAIHSYIRNESKKKQKLLSVDIYDDDGKLKESELEKVNEGSIIPDSFDEFHKDKLEDLIQELLKKLEANNEDDFIILDEILKNDINELGDDELAKKIGIDIKEFKLAKRRIKYTANQIIKMKR